MDELPTKRTEHDFPTCEMFLCPLEKETDAAYALNKDKIILFFSLQSHSC